MKNKHNKRGLSRLLCTFNLGCGVTVDSIDDGVFGHGPVVLKARLARKPNVAATVLNSAAPCTVYAQLAMRATTHSQRKRMRWKTQHRTITIMNMTVIVMNRMKMKMTSWLIDG